MWGLLSYKILTRVPREMAVRLSARIQFSEGLRGADFHLPGWLTHTAVGRRPCFLVTVTSSQDCLSFLTTLRLVSLRTGSPRESKAESTGPFVTQLPKSPTIISAASCTLHRPVCSVWMGTTQGHGRKDCWGSTQRLATAPSRPGGGVRRPPASPLGSISHGWHGKKGLFLTLGDGTEDVMVSCFSTPGGVCLKLRPHPYLMSSCPLSLASLLTFS